MFTPDGRRLLPSILQSEPGANGILIRQTDKGVVSCPEYLALNYFQLRYAQAVELLVARGIITRAELHSGRPTKGTQKALPPLTADKVAAWFANGNPKRRAVEVAPQFRVGQRVRARNINPPTHTRLPR